MPIRCPIVFPAHHRVTIRRFLAHLALKKNVKPAISASPAISRAARSALALGARAKTIMFRVFYSLQASISSQDNNTTFLIGTGLSLDKINPVNAVVRNERKHSNEFMLGLTQVLTPTDIAQIVLTHVDGKGYYADPYKSLDRRPRQREQNVLLLRWNHHFAALGSSNRLSYRNYADSYGISSHSLEEEYVQPFGTGWKFTPSLRYYTQSAARFYYDPVYDSRFRAPFPVGYNFLSKADISSDQRLSAFGALNAWFAP